MHREPGLYSFQKLCQMKDAVLDCTAIISDMVKYDKKNFTFMSHGLRVQYHKGKNEYYLNQPGVWMVSTMKDDKIHFRMYDSDPQNSPRSMYWIDSGDDVITDEEYDHRYMYGITIDSYVGGNYRCTEFDHFELPEILSEEGMFQESLCSTDAETHAQVLYELLGNDVGFVDFSLLSIIQVQKNLRAAWEEHLVTLEPTYEITSKFY